MEKKALLLYSGGLDTSVMIKWLQEKLGYEVSTLTLDVGQEKNNLKLIADKAKRLGAVEAITKDVTSTFAEDYVSLGILGDALYEGSYPLSTSFARPLMAKEAVEVAHLLDCDTIVHGSTGKGNDQVRFEVSIRALDEDLKVIAPVRDMNMNRDDEIEYAKANGIEVPFGGKYSVDENLWGRSVEGSTIEHISEPVPKDAYQWVIYPENAKDLPDIVKIDFEQGLPVALDGTSMSLRDIIISLNTIAGSNGVGAIEVMENRVVGIKSHEFYECPAAITILKGHKYLESAILNKKELNLKSFMDNQLSEYVYSGLWFDPVMDHIWAMEKSLNEHVSGTVNLKLYKGSVTPMGLESTSALYDISLSSYGKGQTFDQAKSPGYIYVFGNETVLTRKARSTIKEQPEIRIE